jgi:hypothetical protein
MIEIAVAKQTATAASYLGSKLFLDKTQQDRKAIYYK